MSITIDKMSAADAAHDRSPQASTVRLLDPLSEATQAIEDLADEAAALGQLRKLLNEQVRNDFALGGVLLRMKEMKWFGGHSSFEELCLQEFGCKSSKAYYLANIHKALRDYGVSWDQAETVGGLKLRLICAAAVAYNFDASDFSTCVENARNWTVPQLKSKLEEMSGAKISLRGRRTPKARAAELEISEAALPKAKASAGTSLDVVPIEDICRKFITEAALPGAVPPSTLAHQAVASKFANTGLCVGYASGDEPISFSFRYSGEPTLEHGPVLHEQDLKIEPPFPMTAVLLINPHASPEDLLLALRQIEREIREGGLFLGVDPETGANVFAKI
jgi:hypothetical protein